VGGTWSAESCKYYTVYIKLQVYVRVDLVSSVCITLRDSINKLPIFLTEAGVLVRKLSQLIRLA
jgi:hypothetical protein